MSKIPILSYHNIGRGPAGSQFKLLYVDQEKFDRQLWTIRRLGLRGVSVGEGLPRLGSNAKSNLVMLTFDDGYADTLTQALPLLKKYGFTATCYLVSDAIGGHNQWDAEYVAERKPLMSQVDVQHWLASGMEIGAHSRSHPKLEEVDDETARDEIIGSREALRAAFDVSVDHFAYPFGRFTDVTAAIVERAGYLSAVSLLPGVACATDDRYRLPRIFVDGERGWLKFFVQVATPYENRHRHSASA
ncbi:MAG TPA: polysaccharide deacetylase family protein [Steroidobacteraceae bacterium]|nr:polysaccharide deacetylase family protein [Steroidobacteraceae bacterium]